MVFILSLTFTAFDNVPIENVLLVQYDFVKTASGIKKRQDLSFYDFFTSKGNQCASISCTRPSFLGSHPKTLNLVSDTCITGQIFCFLVTPRGHIVRLATY